MENWVDEKRVRREIANSNERRRMQSINSGFQSLRTLLPQSEGEKLSKVKVTQPDQLTIHLFIIMHFWLQAAILQQTTEYIYQLEQEKSRLVAQNCHLKRLLGIQNLHQILIQPLTFDFSNLFRSFESQRPSWAFRNSPFPRRDVRSDSRWWWCSTFWSIN